MSPIIRRILAPIRKHWMIGLFIFVFSFGNIFWIREDTSLPLWDIAGHSERSAHYADLLKHGWTLAPFTQDYIYPPLPYFIAAIGFLVAGQYEDVPQFSFLFWVIVYCLGLYIIGLEIFQKRWLALCIVALSFAFPILAHFTRIFDLDFPLTAAVTLALALLLRTKHFSRRLPSILFGIAFGAALLVKWTAIVFILGPLLVECIAVLRDKKNGVLLNFLTKPVQNIFISCLLTLLVGAPWYILHGRNILASAIATRHNIFSVPYEELLSFGNAWYYVERIYLGSTWILALLALFGFILWIRDRHQPQRWFILSWFFISYFVMTFFFYSKESRYILPVYPVFSILIMKCILQWKRKLSIALAAFVVMWGSIIFLQTSFRVPILSGDLIRFLGLRHAYGFRIITPEKPGYGFTFPTHYQQNTKKISASIFADIQKEKRTGTINIIIVPNSIFLTAQQIKYYGRLMGLDTLNNPFTVRYDLSSAIRKGEDWKTIMLQADYVITKTGDQGPAIWDGTRLKAIEQEEKKKTSFFDNFVLLETWDLRGIEGSPKKARLYKVAQ